MQELPDLADRILIFHRVREQGMEAGCRQH